MSDHQVRIVVAIATVLVALIRGITKVVTLFLQWRKERSHG